MRLFVRLILSPVLLLLPLGCGEAPTAATLSYQSPDGEAQTVQAALDTLHARCAAAAEPVPVAPSTDPDLLTRLQLLELKVATLESSGLGKANLTVYDPGRTTLDARNVQDALDGLAARVQAVEDQARQSGSSGPGPGLFELRDKAGNPLPPAGSANRPPNGQAPSGPPPLGQPPR